MRVVEYKVLFKVRIRLRNVIFTFVDTDLDERLSKAPLAALIPSLLGMLVYTDLTWLTRVIFFINFWLHIEFWSFWV